MTDPMQQAREFLAAEIGAPVTASSFAGTLPAGVHTDAALRAIAAALRAAPEGPETHYHCADGIHGTLRRLRRYAKQGDNRNSLQGQTMEEAAAFIEHALAARPQGVKDVR
ncbi:hypothetical protein [Stenotrophomonas acidaminiphila]|uniref:hypothetical protein n=1 Tax=Stenotrophomonas acidaminiphila TaxID=128780 RepID=UPI003D091163